MKSHAPPFTPDTPGLLTVQEGKTLLHVETANLSPDNDQTPGLPLCSIPKRRAGDA